MVTSRTKLVSCSHCVLECVSSCPRRESSCKHAVTSFVAAGCLARLSWTPEQMRAEFGRRFHLSAAVRAHLLASVCGTRTSCVCATGCRACCVCVCEQVKISWRSGANAGKAVERVDQLQAKDQLVVTPFDGESTPILLVAPHHRAYLCWPSLFLARVYHCGCGDAAAQTMPFPVHMRLAVLVVAVLVVAVLAALVRVLAALATLPHGVRQSTGSASMHRTPACRRTWSRGRPSAPLCRSGRRARRCLPRSAYNRASSTPSPTLTSR
jgi:hypothetical protein